MAASRVVTLEESTATARVDALVAARAGPEVGLVVGRLAVGSRDVVVALVPTPGDSEGGGGGGVVVPDVSSKAKGKKGKGGQAAGGPAVRALNVDAEWVAEHAAAVGRMLPGGLSVVGVYAFCAEAALKQALPALGDAVRAAAEAAPCLEQGAPSDRVLLHVCSATRKCTARRCEGTAAPRVVELKHAKILGGFHAVECDVALDAALPAQAGADLRAAAKKLLQRESARIAAADVAVGVELPDPAAQVTAVLGKDGALGGAPAAARLFLPLGAASDAAAGPAGACAGRVTLRGTLRCRAYVYGREPFSRLVEALRADAIASLRARLDLLCESEEAAAEEAEEEGGGPPAGPLLSTPGAAPIDISFARRAFLPWLPGGVELCDHLAPGEAPEDCASRAGELLGDAVGSAAEATRVDVAESEPAGPPAGAWAPGGGGAAGHAAVGGSAAAPAGGSTTSTALYYYAAAAAAVLASAVGAMVLLDDD